MSNRPKLNQGQKDAASRRQREYALSNPDKMKARTQKAIATKIAKGYDFGSAMRGKSQTELSKKRSSETISAFNLRKSTQSNIEINERINSSNLLLLSPINDTHLVVSCNVCSTKFEITKQYFHPSKFKLEICPTCYPRQVKQSKGELELFSFIQSMAPDAISGYKIDSKYHNKEIDVFVPSHNIGFEFNGLYYHSESVLTANNKPALSDYLKQKEFREKGIRIIPIFSDEWENQLDIVKSRITNILHKSTKKIYARKCTVKEISSKEASNFCNENHSMGKGRSNIRIGAYYNDELVSVMTFSKNNLSRKIVGWELNRFVSKTNLLVVGGASKCFSKFIELINPMKVISYSDNRWSTGTLYENLGFIKVTSGTPNYWYFKPNTGRIHRFTLRKNKSDDQNKTEYENRLAQGYDRIWDCGSSKWEWQSKK